MNKLVSPATESLLLTGNITRIVTPLPPTTESPLKPLVDTELQLTRKCFDELGCVENSEEWFHILHRPISLLPFDREVVNTRFILYTKNTTDEPKMVTANKTALLEANFNPKLPTKFIVHGFIDTGFSSWVIKMAQSLVKERDYNVLAVDWGAGSLPLYTQATANARLVGLEVGYLINYLKKHLDVDPADVHVIGHSLGAHIAGYAGERVEGLGRITGLDPAEPYFQNMPEFVRLDPGDAKLVDTIHTDSRSILLLGYGMSQPCGHLDFYPNDGFQQPGCEITDVPLNLIQAKGLNPLEVAQREVIACNHNRAIYYFLESITNKCQYIGHACDNYRSYLKGECYACGHDGSMCAIMGLDADKYHNVVNRTLVKFYVSTSKNPPYCCKSKRQKSGDYKISTKSFVINDIKTHNSLLLAVYHYRVKLQLAFPLIAAEWVTGKLKITIEGDQNTLSQVDLTPEDNMRLDHGKNFTFLVQSHMKLGEIKKVSLDWTYSYNYYDLMSACWAYLCNSKLFMKRIEIVDMDELVNHVKTNPRSESIFHRFCGEEGTTYTGINSGSSSEFDRIC
ncbi:Pancreatic triacylglycerol lipase [Orchesella cincta]|uniref:Pancreatic triacylglycerol lipase n=1 Tax=Orchesella cincta TaxID=48709 RepID=A0A1D2MJV0_ORCCI|nr:Pancreatic triacylglycerol lipase [Orchesella cincta]